MIQVNKIGSENLLKNGVYKHENWMDTPRDSAHGNVRIGDILVIYFGTNSIGFQKQVKKIYRVNSVSNNNTTFNISEIKELNGISLERIKASIQHVDKKEVFNRIGQQGFNIVKMEKADYDQLLSLDNTLSSAMAPLTFRDLQIFLLKEMQMQANYQPVMIKTLLLAGGAPLLHR